MLVWLASFPRSGNTFFRVLLKQLYGFSTYDLHEPDPPPRPQFQDIIGETKLAVPLSQLARDDRHHIVKTHEVPLEDSPAIYIVRDGRDAIASYARFLLKSGNPGDRQDLLHVMRRLIESPHSYGGWSGNVRAWTQRTAPTAIVRFDDLIADPLDQVRRAMAAIGLFPAESGAARAPAFSELHKLDPQFFRSGRTGGWREDMPGDLQLLFWRRHGEAMRSLGFRDGEPTAQQLAGNKPLHPGERLQFGIGGAGAMALGFGWSEPESWGTWSIGPRATLHLSVDRHQSEQLRLDLGYRSFIEGDRALEITCLSQERQLSSWVCNPASWRGVQRIAIPPDFVNVDGSLNLEFRLSEPRSPAELGISSDTRQLGIGVESLQLAEG